MQVYHILYTYDLPDSPLEEFTAVYYVQAANIAEAAQVAESRRVYVVGEYSRVKSVTYVGDVLPDWSDVNSQQLLNEAWFGPTYMPGGIPQ